MGFLGFGNYAKEGPGIHKDAPEKRRFFVFFELYFRKFWKIIQLNLLFVLFSIPIVTIGPAMAGMTYVLRNFSQEKHSFVFSDFWDEFKKNFKQAFPAGIIHLLVVALATFATITYYVNTPYQTIFYVLLAISIFVDIIITFAHYYIYLMIVTLDLKLKAIYKNALIFVFAGLKQNIFTFFWSALIIVLTFLIIPEIGILLFIVITPATLCFITAFNCYPLIVKYCIDPYYEKHQEENPENQIEDVESIFSDEVLIKDNNTEQ